jgi:hypothetical protein
MLIIGMKKPGSQNTTITIGIIKSHPIKKRSNRQFLFSYFYSRLTSFFFDIDSITFDQIFNPNKKELKIQRMSTIMTKKILIEMRVGIPIAIFKN